MENHNLIKRHYEELYESHTLKQYRAYIRNEESDEEVLLGRYLLDIHRNPELLQNLPESVKASYAYYSGRDIGWLRVCQVEYENDVTYAVLLSTDGDDGWLEIYDQHGKEIGVGRTYIELIGWGKVDEIRAQVQDFSFPRSLQDKEKRTLWSLNGCAIGKDSSDRFFVVAEDVPSEKQDDVIRIMCDEAGVTAKAILAVLDCLPHSITRNVSQKKAEGIWSKLTELGVRVSIKEYQSNRWVVVKSSDSAGHAAEVNNL